MAGTFPDRAEQKFGDGLYNGVFTLQWYWGNGRRRKGESVSNRHRWKVCGEGFTGVWAPACAGVTESGGS